MRCSRYSFRRLTLEVESVTLVTLGKLEKPPALKTLAVVDLSVYQFLRPGQYPDTDIVPRDSEVKRLFSLSRSNLGKDLAYCSETEGKEHDHSV